MDQGYCGKLLRVDLSREKITSEFLDESLVAGFLGGSGIGTKTLFDEVPAGVPAFSPDNKVIFMTGPLTGTPVPGTPRFEAVFKSPQTEAFGEANAGGRWGPELKWAGYDGIIIEGCAGTPKYLLITNEGAKLKDAGHLWGKDTVTTEQLVKEESGSKFRVACIGPAGENLVWFSSIISEGRAAARTGPGAVMGSKKLKAIAVCGNQKPPLAFPDKVKELAKTYIKRLRESQFFQGMSSNGTAGGFLARESYGYGIVKNWQMGLSEYPGKEEISGQALTAKHLVRRESCYSCPVGCKRITKTFLDGAEVQVHGPEYETIASLGSQCLNYDMKAIIHAHHLCNILGLDGISAGAVVAFAMECYERGLIPAGMLNGERIPWGDKEVIFRLLKKIVHKQGALGQVLSQGVKAASESLGEEAVRCAVQVKGVEVAMHDPRSCQGTGIIYAVGNAGARHTEGLVWPESFPIKVSPLGYDSPLDRTTVVGKAEAATKMQNLFAVFNSSGICYFVYGPPDYTNYIAEFLEVVTGRQRTYAELIGCGERIFNLKRLFNAREGIGREDDTLPYRFTHEPITGELPAKALEILDEYYTLRGWDAKTGWPTEAKLAELSLVEEGKALYS